MNQFKPWTEIQQVTNYGFADMNGSIIAEIDLTAACPFSEGYAAITSPDLGGTYMDLQGTILPGLDVCSTLSFSNGLAAVNKGNRFGFMDKSFNMVIEPQYDFVYGGGHTTEGTAKVGIKKEIVLINDKGDIILRPPTNWFLWGVPSEGLISFKAGEKYGFYNLAGEIVIEPVYDSALEFKNGLATVMMNGKYGCISPDNEVVIPFKFSRYIGPFSEGLAVLHRANNRKGYLNADGKVQIPAQFYEADDFREGLACVMGKREDDTKYGFIDKTGEYFIPPKYDWASGFNGQGYAPIRVNEVPGYVDRKGEEQLFPQFKGMYLDAPREGVMLITRYKEEEVEIVPRVRIEGSIKWDT